MNSNAITIKAIPATNIEAGQTYGFVSVSGVMAKTMTITQVHNGIASAIASHWDQSWQVTFDAETGEGVGDFVGARLIYLMG